MADAKRGVFHWDPERKCIVDGPAPRRSDEPKVVAKRGDGFGMSVQFPKWWGKGMKGVRHIPSGPHRGRIMFTTRQEAKDIGKRHEDVSGFKTTYDH